MNDLELCVYGVKRSGNHAIIYWLINLFRDRRVVFVNDASLSKADPFFGKNDCRLFGFDKAIATGEFHSIRCDVFLYSFEDSLNEELLGRDYMDCVLHQETDLQRRETIGSFKKRIRIMVLRDPFNCFSSRLRSSRGGSLDREKMSIREVASNWKKLAHRALSEERSAAFDDELVILFNRGRRQSSQSSVFVNIWDSGFD